MNFFVKKPGQFNSRAMVLGRRPDFLRLRLLMTKYPRVLGSAARDGRCLAAHLFFSHLKIDNPSKNRDSPGVGRGKNLLEKPFDNLGVSSYCLHPLDGVVAQLVEHHNGIVGVAGSIPVGSTSF